MNKKRISAIKFVTILAVCLAFLSAISCSGSDFRNVYVVMNLNHHDGAASFPIDNPRVWFVEPTNAQALIENIESETQKAIQAQEQRLRAVKEAEWKALIRGAALDVDWQSAQQRPKDEILLLEAGQLVESRMPTRTFGGHLSTRGPLDTNDPDSATVAGGDVFVAKEKPYIIIGMAHTLTTAGFIAESFLWASYLKGGSEYATIEFTRQDAVTLVQAVREVSNRMKEAK